MKKLNLKDPKVSKQLIEDAFLNIHIDPSTIFNPLRHIPDEMAETPHLYIMWLMQQPEYFSFICSEILRIEILPFQAVILKELWNRKLPMLIGSRGMSKSFMLALYTFLRLLLLPQRKVVIVGAAFRQSKILFNYMNTMYNNAPILKDIVGGTSMDGGPHKDTDMYTFKVFDSIATMLPLGDGQKIRGQRANDIIADELDSINKDILEQVVFGFAAVSSDPVGSVKREASSRVAKALGIDFEIQDDKLFKSNQIITSGTAGYSFKHFCEYWKKWKRIIHTKGDEQKLREIFEGAIPPGFNWKDYSIIRIPFEKLPSGFMDEGIVAQAKASIHSGQYNMEYGAVFSDDTVGFFKRSLIEGCTVSNRSLITLPSEKDIIFNPLIYGNKERRYIYGIDPASEHDNFCIVVLELLPDHSRVVYCWTANKKDFNEDKKDKAVAGSINDFYSYVINKIKLLMQRFPCERIMIDTQGGGHMIIEGLHDITRMAPLPPVWPVITPGKPELTDGEAGLHLIEPVQFSSARWTSDANHGLKKDMEDKLLLFPYIDAAILGMALETESSSKLSDKMEDCVFEIETLKDELTTIVHQITTGGNRERWDTVEVKLTGTKKTKKRKDRYSALLMANMGARQLRLNPQMVFSPEIGGFVMTNNGTEGKRYTGPAWLVDRLQSLYD
jgi:hypothetical protein